MKALGAAIVVAMAQVTQEHEQRKQRQQQLTVARLWCPRRVWRRCSRRCTTTTVPSPLKPGSPRAGCTCAATSSVDGGHAAHRPAAATVGDLAGGGLAAHGGEHGAPSAATDGRPCPSARQGTRLGGGGGARWPQLRHFRPPEPVHAMLLLYERSRGASGRREPTSTTRRSTGVVHALPRSCAGNIPKGPLNPFCNGRPWDPSLFAATDVRRIAYQWM